MFRWFSSWKNSCCSPHCDFEHINGSLSRVLSMAAHQICLQVWLSASLLVDAQGTAAQALIASFFAKRDYRRVKEIIYLALKPSCSPMTCKCWILLSPDVCQCQSTSQFFGLHF